LNADLKLSADLEGFFQFLESIIISSNSPNLELNCFETPKQLALLDLVCLEFSLLVG